ncbi:hypothetical protein GGTG_08383 [Gaeumannomyces tritici R3-111a-1]|uniref:4a-hydroxytetrahydrobiopterin dehydratase n=1 Tax=Gaeumannomyces tritici (strain R3-111a-1) TaxID=644352 RepID=J3P4E7_GAET3|nr:hypothetical protein GGTG_08383 [Gaeumannomyces tritici R3-111a-1]EJT74543.1 hypothetical protein GGTG_08383 [Gaeumannomyces tritici R3-111a-1]
MPTAAPPVTLTKASNAAPSTRAKNRPPPRHGSENRTPSSSTATTAARAFPVFDRRCHGQAPPHILARVRRRAARRRPGALARPLVLVLVLPAPGPGGRWTLTVDGGGLERSFRFKTFAKTWDFMTAVSLQCKIRNHHPEWSNVYNTTFIRWTTHNPKGLSALDVELAAKCDELARQFGEQQQEESPPKSASCNLQDLASTAATSSGNCCGPKK